MIRRTAITFFGLGCIPFAPGTWGSLGAIVAAGLLLAQAPATVVDTGYELVPGATS